METINAKFTVETKTGKNNNTYSLGKLYLGDKFFKSFFLTDLEFSYYETLKEMGEKM